MNVRCIALTAAAATAVMTSAHAGTVDVEFTGTGLGRSVRTHLDGRAQNVFAGQLRHAFSNGTEQCSELDGGYLTFCTELTQYVTSQESPYECLPLEAAPPSHAMGAVRAQAMRDLYAYADGAQFATSGTSDNRDLAAAFQIAVWEIVYDYDGTASSLDAAAGNLRVTKTDGNPLSGGVSGYLDSFFGGVGTGAELPELFAVTNSQYQDQLVMIPLPLPLAMGAVGLAAVIWRRRVLARRAAG
ncbi:MAG: hypothetical protein SYC29_09205 [Planctomycetota bacterium]|nr:hypothetical protein [Planctomycetota bacterium]